MRIVLLASLLLLVSCKSKKAINSSVPIDAFEDNLFTFKSMESALNINFSISKPSIRDTFDQVLNQVLMLDLDLKDYDVVVDLEKTEVANVEFEGKQILVDFPIKVEITKETFLSDIKAEGLLHVYFYSDVNINADWNLVTDTRLINHEWIEKPTAKLGIISIPIEKITDKIIDRTAVSLTKEIDDSIKNNFQLRDYILSFMEQASTPFLIDENTNSWLQVSPTEFDFMPFLNQEDWTIGKAIVKGNTAVSAIEPELKELDLPQFNWKETPQDSSHLYMQLDFGYDEINHVLRQQYVGETFEDGGRSITIQDIELKGLKNKLGALIDVKGSFNGKILISAIPKYISSENRFDAEKIDIKVYTKNVLHKAAAWMLKGKIKNRLKDMMQLSMNDQVIEVQHTIDNYVQSLNKENELDIHLGLENIKFDQFYFDNRQIHALLHIPFLLDVKVYNLNTFYRFSSKEEKRFIPD